jgi:hypothetical protein
MEFIDIRGASGNTYRFRRWPDRGTHPPMAGNYVLVSRGGRSVVAVGALEDLSQARSVLGERAKGCELFTRLNIARRAREAEHEDMALEHPEAAEKSTAATGAERAA